MIIFWADAMPTWGFWNGKIGRCFKSHRIAPLGLSQNRKRNDLTEKEKCGQEQHSPNFPTRGKMVHRGSNMRPHAGLQTLEIHMKWADGAVANRRRKERHLHCKISCATEEKSLCHAQPQCSRRRDANRKLDL